jgi:hypothetical protein
LTACGGGDTASVTTDPITDAVTTQGATDAVTTGAAETEAATVDPSTVALTYEITDNGGENGIDFIIDFSEGRDIRLLQLTDTQAVRLEGARNDGILNDWVNNQHIGSPEEQVYPYMDAAVEAAKPDLIVLTGDNTSGDSDDSGELLPAFIAKMDSYGIPWIAVFGNHDCETVLSVNWMVQQYQNAEYSIFKQGSVTGNCNYNLLIRQGGKAKHLLYLLDTHGSGSRPEGAADDELLCHGIGLQDDQLAWLKSSSAAAFSFLGTEVPTLLFFHVPPIEAASAIDTFYPNINNLLSHAAMPFRPDREGDLGEAREGYGGFYHPSFWATAKEIGCIGMFMGHQHKIATSIVFDGIRLTYGLKTGQHAYHHTTMLGGTLISLSREDSGFSVAYLKYAK